MSTFVIEDFNVRLVFIPKMLSSYNFNSSSLCLFHAIWLAGENVLHFDKFHEQESIFLPPVPKMSNNIDKNMILMTKLEL